MCIILFRCSAWTWWSWSWSIVVMMVSYVSSQHQSSTCFFCHWHWHCSSNTTFLLATTSFSSSANCFLACGTFLAHIQQINLFLVVVLFLRNQADTDLFCLRTLMVEWYLNTQTERSRSPLEQAEAQIPKHLFTNQICQVRMAYFASSGIPYFLIVSFTLQAKNQLADILWLWQVHCIAPAGWLLLWSSGCHPNPKCSLWFDLKAVFVEHWDRGQNSPSGNV